MSPSTPSTEAALSRLCVSCGLCCNGVLFHLVRLQPADSPRELTAVGMKLKRKRQQHHFHQPCAFLKRGGCSIYQIRPQRCRLFECRQIEALRKNERSESEAVETIRGVQQRVQEIETLLLQAGNTKVQQPLAERYARVMAVPTRPEWDAELHAVQQVLHAKMQELNEILNRQFRLQDIPLPEVLENPSPPA